MAKEATFKSAYLKYTNPELIPLEETAFEIK